MNQSTLASLAILKVNWDDKGHDYADNFLPFVLEAINESEDREISVPALQKQIREDFGLIIPQGALNTLLRRAERRSAVKREHGVFVRVAEPALSDFARERQEVVRKQAALVEKLVLFVQTKYDIVLTSDEAESALLKHLQESCIPILAAATEGCPIPPIKHSVKHAEFVVSAFTVHLHEMDPEGFAFLEAIAKGNMLATALFIPEIGQAAKKFKGLTVYIDTQILLRALGLEGVAFREPAVELLTLLYEMNVNLACFDITYGELRRILDAAQNALKEPSHLKRGTFSVYENFVTEGFRASDVEMIIAGLERSLKHLHVNVKERPAHLVSYSLNETKLSEIVRQELPHQGADAQRHDIDCMTSIHRLRRGQAKSSIESCEQLFITTNNSLARASARFFIEEHERLTVPLCVNDHTMATLAWVKNPTLVSDWARNRLIADSVAALRPSNELWKKYRTEVARLQDRGEITEEDCNLLRFSMVARNALVDSTLGSPDAFTHGTVKEVLEVARAQIRKDDLAALSAEKEKRLVAEATAEARDVQIRNQLAKQSAKIATVAFACGKFVRWTSYALLSSIAIAGFVLTLPATALPFDEPKHWLVPIVIFIFGLLAIWNLQEGGAIRAIARNLETKTAKAAERKLLKIFGLEN